MPALSADRYAQAMRSVPRLRIALLSTLAFLFAGVANVHAHVHLCLDGQEPPAAMHVDDPHPVDHHFDHHVDQQVEAVDSHQDVDVDVPAQAVAQTIAKTLKVELPCLGPVASSQGFAPLVAETGALPEVDRSFSPVPLPHWRPPLRGPPR